MVGTYDELAQLDYKLLISQNADWQYLANEHPQGQTWTRRDFDAAKWKTGTAGFGLRHSGVKTELTRERNKPASIYLRREFTVPQADAVTEIGLMIDYRDGFIAYLNGREVARHAVLDVVEGGAVREQGQALEQVAEAALLDVFWSKGYEGSAIRDLCAATDLRPASLYAAFGDKDQMFQAALGRYLTWIEAHLTPEQDGRDGVRHILETTCRLTLADRERRGCAIINAVADRENLSPRANATVHQSFDRLRDLLRRQVHASFASAPPAGAEAMVNLLVGATVSIRLLGRAGATSADLRSTAVGAVDAFNTWAG